MNIEKINDATARLAVARKQLNEAKSVYDGLKSIGHHQSDVYIKLGGYGFFVSGMGRDYMSHIKKGYDMVYLGLLKVSDAEVDRLKALCLSIEAEILSLVDDKA